MYKLFRHQLIPPFLCLLPLRYPPLDIPLCLLIWIQLPVPDHLRVIAPILLNQELNPFLLPLALQPLCFGRE